MKAITECHNCSSIWSPGSEEYDWQKCFACGWEPGQPIDDDDDGDMDDFYEDQEEEELSEMAANCTCGAWALTKKGSVVHVADCCCGGGY